MEINEEIIKQEIENDWNTFIIKELNNILNTKSIKIDTNCNDMNKLLIKCWSEGLDTNGIYLDKKIEEIIIEYIKNKGTKNIERIFEEPLDTLIMRLQVYFSSFCMLDSSHLLLNLLKTNYYGTNLLITYDKIIKLQFNIPELPENKLLDIVKNDITKDITRFLFKKYNEYTFKEILLLLILLDLNIPGTIHCLFAKNFSLFDIMKNIKNNAGN